MESVGVTIIVICSYIVGEIYKKVRKEETYKFIPIITSLSGGLLGILMYLSNKEMLFNVPNIYIALLIGLISGSSATGTNQIIKQLYKERKE